MKDKNKLIKYKTVRKWFSNILYKIKNKFIPSKLWDKETEDKINSEFTNESEQKEAKVLLEELLTRNNNLLKTLDIRMLKNEIVDLFGKPRLERIITDKSLQKDILELSKEELQVYNYILNYNVVNFNDRISSFYTHSCKGLKLEDLQNLNEKERLKAISIILSKSDFRLNNLSELDNYYEKKRKMCQEIIDNPKIVEKEYQKEFSLFPFGLLYDMQKLSDLDRIRYGIIEAKYGINFENAQILYNSFGDDIEDIEQSEETRIMKEIKFILEENNIDKLKQISLDENYANYKGTINIISNLKNAYLHKYQEKLYQINEEDYIDTQDVKIKGKKADVKIYNALGKNNDRADFNMILTSLGGIYTINHNYDDLKADWDRADKNHTISCSYIRNDFIGVVNENYLLAFSDIEENELLRAGNQDIGTVDSPFEILEDLEANKFLTPQNAINSSKRYNELFIERKIEKDGKLINRTPTFAVFIAENINDINNKKDYRWKETKRLAAELGIPIVVIDGTQCTKLEFEKVQEMVKSVKEEGKMDLIPEIIHKIENNRGAKGVILEDIRNEVFSETKIKKILEEIVGAIITSDTTTFNQGIEEFVKVTRKIKKIYSEKSDDILESYKTYDYDKYLDRLKTLFTSRNGLNGDETIGTQEAIFKAKEYNNEI